MAKSLLPFKKKEDKEPKAKMFIPRTTSQIMSMFFKEFDEKTGVIRVDDNHYSICYEYTDVSFTKASTDRQKDIFLNYVDYLNSLDLKTKVQVVHCGIPVSTKEFKKNFVFDVTDDMSENQKKLADEFNSTIESNLGNKSTTFCETRLIVITVEANDFEDANNKFFDYQMQLEEQFQKFGSKITKWNLQKRFKLLYDTFNIKPFDLTYHNNEDIIQLAKKQDISIYDFLAPKEDISCREQNYIRVGNISDDEDTENPMKYIKLMYVSKFPTSITPEFYNELTTLADANIIVTENITPTNPAKTIKSLDKKISALKDERLQKIKRAAKNDYSYEYVKDEKLEDQIDDYSGLRDALSHKKQKLFKKNILICVMDSNYESLNVTVTKVKSIAARYLVDISNLDWQQLEGVQNLLPFGINNLQFQRSLHSEACATSVPFNSKTLMHPKALYYGTDISSKTLLSADRKLLINGNGCVLATSGAGKSFMIKTIIEQISLRYPQDTIFILDPMGEYMPVVSALGGQTVEISTTTSTYINPFDMGLQKYTEGDPIKEKIEYILAFMESIVGRGGLSGEQESIIDRAAKNILTRYVENPTDENKPSFPLFYSELKTYPESEAENLVLILERYVQGGMDIFSKDTNIDIHNKIVCFDLHNLTSSMQTTGYLVVLEHIMNKVKENNANKFNSWLFVDEFHVLLENMYSANYISRIYKMGRKQGVLPTIVTQNISDVLNSEDGCKILSNSEFAIILRQKPLDLAAICKIFNISAEEASFCSSSSPVGQGLVVYGEDIVPFKNQFPKESYVYSLNNTDTLQIAR